MGKDTGITIKIEVRYPSLSSEHSIASNLLYDIITSTKADELIPFERLYVAENAGLKTHKGWHNDLYMKCGCFEKAREYFLKRDHARKLGDIAWILGDLDSAYDYYSRPRTDNKEVFRSDKDWDRLIKLSFFNEEWTSVIRFISEAPISPGLGKGRIILCSSEVAGTPYLNMLAVAVSKCGQPRSQELNTIIEKTFQLDLEGWNRLTAAASVMGDLKIKQLQKRCLPGLASIPALSLDEACAKGKTPRAHAVLSFLRQADDLVAQARRDVKAFVQTGKQKYLDDFLKAVLLPGISSVSQSFLFTAMDNEGYNPTEAPVNRLIKLYSCHPIMNKRYFGRLLDVKFRSKTEISGGDILTGIFQRIGSINSGGGFAIEGIYHFEPKESEWKGILDIPKLTSCRDWAEMRLQEWVFGEGKDETEKVAEIWRKGTAKKVTGPFDTVKSYPRSPREMAEWSNLISLAMNWLEPKWQKEIGTSPWVSENRLFQMIKHTFKPCQVIHHAQPVWLAPQHLDVFIPELSLAIEYMGKQHYEPVEFFGGEEGFHQIVERDREKAATCQKAGINLVYVRYDEDITKRMKEIKQEFLT